MGEGEATTLIAPLPNSDGDEVDYVIAADLPERPLNPPSLLTLTETSIKISLEEVDASRNGGSEITRYLV